MFKKPTRTQFIIRRIALSIVASVSVAIIVTVAILFMLGYRLNTTGTLQQGALLQFDSQPNNAEVYVDGRLLGGRTATKQTVVAGVHAIEMRKAGYENWSRQVTINPGTLTWLNYTRFVPTERKAASVAQYSVLHQMEFSPDLKWALAHETEASPAFQYIDLRTEDIKTQLVTLPADLYADADTPGVAHTFSIVRWNTPSRHVLIRHSFADKQEWLVLDTHDSTRSVNVTRLLNTDFKDLQFAGTNGSVLYGVTSDGLVRKLDLGSGTLSRAFITHVDSFQMFSTNIIVYTGTKPGDAALRVAGVYRDGDEASNVLRETSVDTPLSIATSQYFGDDYVAIAEGATVTVLKGVYPRSQAHSATPSLAEYATFSTPNTVRSLSFSPSGEYVIAQTDDQFVTYEIEYKRSAVASHDQSGSGRPLQWLDAAHLWGDARNALTMRDFDGSNSHVLMNVTPGFDATLSQNGRFVYAVSKTENGFSLDRVKMILE